MRRIVAVLAMLLVLGACTGGGSDETRSTGQAGIPSPVTDGVEGAALVSSPESESVLLGAEWASIWCGQVCAWTLSLNPATVTFSHPPLRTG
jgi:hypothetical protein